MILRRLYFRLCLGLAGAFAGPSHAEPLFPDPITQPDRGPDSHDYRLQPVVRVTPEQLAMAWEQAETQWATVYAGLPAELEAVTRRYFTPRIQSQS